MTKTIFFDLDGTLTASAPGILNCARLALDHFRIPIPDDQTMKQFVGPPLRVTFAKFGLTGGDIDEAVRVFRTRYTTVGKFENSPYPGVRQLLEGLEAQGHRLFVATSKPEVLALEILHHFDLARYFRLICGATLDDSRESKSDVLAYLLAQVEGDDRPVVMVGDTHYDVLGAKAHGIPTIGVTWGYGEEAALQEAGAVALAHTMDQLYDLLDREGGTLWT